MPGAVVTSSGGMVAGIGKVSLRGQWGGLEGWMGGRVAYVQV